MEKKKGPRKTPNINKMNEETKRGLILKIDIELQRARDRYRELVSAGEYDKGVKVDTSLDIDELVPNLRVLISDETITAEKLFEDYRQQILQISKSGRRSGDPTFNN